MGSRTYFDCAEDDYRGFMKNYEIGNIYNSLGSMAQNICEKYMKHVIEECYQPSTPTEAKRKDNILRTHSLASLVHFLGQDVDIEYPTDCIDSMELIDGWYITTKYPGADAVELNDSDIDDCVKAIKACRAATIYICKARGADFTLLLSEEMPESENTINDTDEKEENQGNCDVDSEDAAQ